MKIAILHEMLIKKWGAEKVVSELINIFPKADLFTLIYDEKKVWNIFPKNTIAPECFKLLSQKVYNITKRQRLCLPFMARSVEALDFSSYDRVIVSSSWFAHGLKTVKDTKTIIYYHAPARYMWDWAHEYRRDINMLRWIRWFLYGRFMKNLRIWDYNASTRNDTLLANSATTQKRIYKYFRRESDIVFPPIETQRFSQTLSNYSPKEIFFSKPYYIILSALTEFKKIDIAVEAFAKIPEVNLLIIWEGEYRKTLEELSWNAANIRFSWAQYWDDLVHLVQNSLGLIFPGEEDFGIVPIEIMAAGKPVFALNKWGLTETVIAWKTGDFFHNEDWSDFIQEFQVFHKNNTKNQYSPKDCYTQAVKYDTWIFKKKIQKHIK